MVESPRKCCPECIGDRHLRKTVFEKPPTEKGLCSYCASEKQFLASPAALRDYFETLKACYVPDDNGKNLVEWFKEDWQLFSHRKMDDAHAKDLLSDIFDDGEVTRRRFSPAARHPSRTLDQWEVFREKLMHENRFFPETSLDTKRLEQLLGYVFLEESPKESWYRARIQDGDNPYTPEEMSAPPKKLASAGRANPAGIPYLYLSSNVPTAMSEVRPHPGEKISVATFLATRTLKIVDLCDPRQTVSPFLLDEWTSLSSLRTDLQFLQHLGEELNRPVIPNAAAIDYIPTQYLCEFIKNTKYDGIKYRSSVADGVNMALFRPQIAKVGEVTERVVTTVTVAWEDE